MKDQEIILTMELQWEEKEAKRKKNDKDDNNQQANKE